MEKVRTDQAALRFVQLHMRLERLFHVRRARFEDLDQVSMAPLEVFENIRKLPLGIVAIEPNNTVDDMIGPGLVRWIEVPRLSRRLEGSDDDPRRIGPQIEVLTVQKSGLRQGVPSGSFRAQPNSRCGGLVWIRPRFDLPQNYA